jgi:uncharacterized Tic20 family protein
MIALLGLILPAFGSFLTPMFSWLNKKQDVNLAGAQAAMSTDVEFAKEQWAAEIQLAQIRAASNAWIGPKIIAGTAGEISAIYYGSIVLDSMFHFGWAISKLPDPWAQYSWIILSSFIVVSPVAPVLSATAAWLGRK